MCRFLLEALEDLDCSLKKLNSRLFVVKGQPTDVFPRLLKVGVSDYSSFIEREGDSNKGVNNVCLFFILVIIMNYAS